MVYITSRVTDGDERCLTPADHCTTSETITREPRPVHSLTGCVTK